jgi:hypothetical protein
MRISVRLGVLVFEVQFRPVILQSMTRSRAMDISDIILTEYIQLTLFSSLN